MLKVVKCGNNNGMRGSLATINVKFIVIIQCHRDLYLLLLFFKYNSLFGKRIEFQQQYIRNVLSIVRFQRVHLLFYWNFFSSTAGCHIKFCFNYTSY